MELKFFRCNHCGNIIVKIKDSSVPVVCCGENMQELVPGTTDAAVEKHLPVYEVNGSSVSVTVGSVLHPMLPEHSINWICLQTNKGFQLKYLNPGEEPKAVFALADGEKVEAVYEYCNLHGLWKA
ncbi:MAG: desulfoferrodoxin family protein [Treponema porcinum]|uniref:Desulfoferrodoxin n=1 Tax=Treponema porcinum TaxID=261392 RepID=A0A1T4KN98_TREPO|nr:desulfoferrodoxin family protein [Treponema porcinum]MCI5645245.1 desulfoferrodoxin [Treponema porcinum]MCI6816174.1 desulfoferrodoxin [Treponema porcinum]MCI7545494.1 desulfoferrodoxin [Treponema porcinum]MDD6898706.1 desulfoferrodoxin family protein [Treponema porcinum]MDY5048021.1 desulfoferrodoxin family protein [Treponema porcinum]